MKKVFPYLEFYTETSNLQLLQYVKNMSFFESFYYIGIANILQGNQTFNMHYCQFQEEAINSLCVYNLQDQNCCFF